MGEYATRKSDLQQVKIGTCEAMYYLRFEHVGKVESPGYSLREPGLWFRLPFPDEDHLQPGDYQDHNRGVRLLPYQASDDPAPIAFTVEGADAGSFQLRHPSGLLLNVACHHGERLPEGSSEISPAWNGKDPHCWELYMVKNQAGEGLLPLVRCRHCGKTYRSTWAAVLPHVQDQELRDRLTDYAAFGTAIAS